jgi:hypothetical protein
MEDDLKIFNMELLDGSSSHLKPRLRYQNLKVAVNAMEDDLKILKGLIFHRGNLKGILEEILSVALLSLACYLNDITHLEF